MLMMKSDDGREFHDLLLLLLTRKTQGGGGHTRGCNCTSCSITQQYARQVISQGTPSFPFTLSTRSVLALLRGRLNEGGAQQRREGTGGRSLCEAGRWEFHD